MQVPVEITFRDSVPSTFVEQLIRDHVREFEPDQDQIIRCHVTLQPHHHYRQGELYVVCVELRLRGRELVVGRDRPGEHAHEDLRIALRDTFAAVKQQLRVGTCDADQGVPKNT